MTVLSSVFQNNLQYEKELSRKAKAIHEAELYELLCILKSKESPSPEEIAKIYTDFFAKEPLCADVLKLCKGLDCPKKCPPFPRTNWRIAHMSGLASLSALSSFTAGINGVYPVELTDFRSLCEAVINERCDFCILPVRSSLEGQYSAFNKLINSYDLKICKYTRVANEYSDEEIQFALLSKRLYMPNEPEFALFSFTADNEGILPSLISTLTDCGVCVMSVYSSPLEYNMDKLSHKIEVRLDSLDPNTLFLFLDTALPNHTVCGLY